MRFRSFGKDSFNTSEVGLGTWQFGGDWGAVDETTALATLEAASESGVNFIDTADVYGAGASERVIGKFLKNRSDKLFVATKLGRRGDPGWPQNFTLDVMRRHTEDSLRNLGVDVIDLTQLHCIPADVLREGRVFDHLRTLREEGKIRRWGVSVESMDEALLCLEQQDISSLQIIFNIFRQKPIDTLFTVAAEKGVALIVRLPLASGLLAGKFTRDSTFSPGDHRHYNADGQAFNVGETFAGIPFAKGVELADGIKPMLPGDCPMSRAALRWVLDFDAVSVIIPGAKNPDQARGNAAASDMQPLPASMHERLRTYYHDCVHEHIRGPY